MIFNRKEFHNKLKEIITTYNEPCGEKDKILKMYYGVDKKTLTVVFSGNGKSTQNKKIWMELLDFLCGKKLGKYHISNIKYAVKTDDLYIYDTKEEQ